MIPCESQFDENVSKNPFYSLFYFYRSILLFIMYIFLVSICILFIDIFTPCLREARLYFKGNKQDIISKKEYSIMTSRIAALQARLKAQKGGGMLMMGMRPGAARPIRRSKSPRRNSLDNSALLNRPVINYDRQKSHKIARKSHKVLYTNYISIYINNTP